MWIVTVASNMTKFISFVRKHKHDADKKEKCKKKKKQKLAAAESDGSGSEKEYIKNPRNAKLRKSPLKLKQLKVQVATKIWILVLLKRKSRKYVKRGR